MKSRPYTTYILDPSTGRIALPAPVTADEQRDMRRQRQVAKSARPGWRNDPKQAKTNRMVANRPVVSGGCRPAMALARALMESMTIGRYLEQVERQNEAPTKGRVGKTQGYFLFRLVETSNKLKFDDVQSLVSFSATDPH